MLTSPTLSPFQPINYPRHSASTEASWVDNAYTVGITHLSSTITTETFENKFSRLTCAWKDSTMFVSSYNQLLSNPSYLEMIAMGEKVLPLIFAEMQKEPGHWFLALNVITSVNPVKPESRGNIPAMTNDWLNWAKSKGYVAK